MTREKQKSERLNTPNSAGTNTRKGGSNTKIGAKNLAHLDAGDCRNVSGGGHAKDEPVAFHVQVA